MMKKRGVNTIVSENNRFVVGITGLSEDMEDFILEQLDYYKINKTKFWMSFYKTCVDMWTELVDLTEKQLNIIEREYNKVKDKRLATGGI
jgi:hypothetical protein